MFLLFLLRYPFIPLLFFLFLGFGPGLVLDFSSTKGRGAALPQSFNKFNGGTGTKNP